MASKTDYTDKGMSKRGRMTPADAAQMKSAAAKAASGVAGRSTASAAAKMAKNLGRGAASTMASEKMKRALTEPVKVQTSRWTRNRPEGA